MDVSMDIPINDDDEPMSMPIYAVMEVKEVRPFGEFGYSVTATNPFGIIFTCYVEADPPEVGDKFKILAKYDDEEITITW